MKIENACELTLECLLSSRLKNQKSLLAIEAVLNSVYLKANPFFSQANTTWFNSPRFNGGLWTQGACSDGTFYVF